MTGTGARSEADTGRHLVLYDGACGLCDRFVRFVLVRDRRRCFRFAALQSRVGRERLAAHGGDPDRLDTVCVVVHHASARERLLTRSAAALFVLGQLGWPWRLAAVLRRAPAMPLDWLYDQVAARRRRIFGRPAVCPAPDPEHRDRFLDA